MSFARTKPAIPSWTEKVLTTRAASGELQRICAVSGHMGLAPLLGRFSLVRGRSAKPHRTAILREFASMPSSPGVNQRGEDVRQEFLPPQRDCTNPSLENRWGFSVKVTQTEAVRRWAEHANSRFPKDMAGICGSSQAPRPRYTRVIFYVISRYF